MSAHRLSDDLIKQAVRAVEVHGSQKKAAEILGIPRETLQSRLKMARRGTPTPLDPIVHPQRHSLEIENGVVLIFGDAHYWPDRISTAHRALVAACRKFGRELRAVICNGDALDGATISRFPPQNWEDRPTLKTEMEACQARLGEIEQASGHVERVWNFGNHDQRYESRLAQAVPEYANIDGVHLKDHFPLWEPAWSTWINDDVVIKHRFKGGIHAGFNNVKDSGKSMVTHHLHKGIVSPFSDYNGTRYGVDSPCLADPYGPQFDYSEDNPRNHRSGFVVLTFWRGRLLAPEMALVMDDGIVDFRGQVWEV